jgi:hypothetical protein
MLLGCKPACLLVIQSHASHGSLPSLAPSLAPSLIFPPFHGVSALKALPALRKKAEAEAAAALAESDEVEEWAQTRGMFSLIESCGTILQRGTEFETELRELTTTADAGAGAGVAAVDSRTRASYTAAAAQLGRPGPALPVSDGKLAGLNEALHALTFETVLAPLVRRLTDLGSKSEWMEEGEAGFSLSPLAYVTVVGEQLLALPQQLEPFMGGEEEGAANLVAIALSASKLPVTAVFDTADGELLSVADEWLGAAAQGVMNTYVEQILKIKKVTGNGAAQLSADIDYLCNVLSALDVSPSTDITHANQLLSVDSAEFAAMAAELAPETNLLKTIKKMRGV